MLKYLYKIFIQKLYFYLLFQNMAIYVNRINNNKMSFLRKVYLYVKLLKKEEI